MRGWRRLFLVPLLLLMLGTSDCDTESEGTGTVDEQAIQDYLRGNTEIEGGTVEYSIPEQPVAGEPWEFVLCVVRKGGLPDEWFASFGTDPTAEPASHARETLGGDGCAAFMMDVNWPAGSTQMLWSSDGQSTYQIVEVDIAG